VGVAVGPEFSVERIWGKPNLSKRDGQVIGNALPNGGVRHQLKTSSKGF
jgi:hypothetical protein